ncbi:MAG: HIT family protein [Candidatus Berkelbacteria bacterium]
MHSPSVSLVEDIKQKDIMPNYEAKTKENKCIFCEIVAGNIPAQIFWQDDDHMAFLSIDPNTEGFSCVIPKKHFGSDVMKLHDEVLAKLMIATKKVSAILENYFGDVGRVGVMMEGLGIDHAHVKLMPMHGTEYLKRGEWQQVLSGKNFWFEKYEGWICSGGGESADPIKLKELGEALKQSQKSLGE